VGGGVDELVEISPSPACIELRMSKQLCHFLFGRESNASSSYISYTPPHKICLKEHI
jgi:hypothetical protein